MLWICGLVCSNYISMMRLAKVVGFFLKAKLSERTAMAGCKLKHTKPKYSKTTRILYPHISRGSRKLQRLESEVMKGLERKKGPFYWE